MGPQASSLPEGIFRGRWISSLASTYSGLQETLASQLIHHILQYKAPNKERTNTSHLAKADHLPPFPLVCRDQLSLSPSSFATVSSGHCGLFHGDTFLVLTGDTKTFFLLFVSPAHTLILQHHSPASQRYTKESSMAKIPCSAPRQGFKWVSKEVYLIGYAPMHVKASV